MVCQKCVWYKSSREKLSNSIDDPKLAGYRDDSNHGYTLLHLAGMHGLIDLARCLLSCGADINAVNVEQQTALHWAAHYGHEAFVQFLLQNGARKDLKNSSGKTPKDYANRAGHNATAGLLVFSNFQRTSV